MAAATLVALLELEEEGKSVGLAPRCFPMEAKAKLDQTVEKYLDPNTLDPGWGQVKMLCSTNASAELGRPFMKERKKKHTCDSGIVFEFISSGHEMAMKLRKSVKAQPVEPGR